MDLQKACDILGITKENFTIKSVKKAYYQKALETHPDKCNGIIQSPSFNEVQDAYAFLTEYNQTIFDESEDTKDTNYSTFLSSFISSTIGIDVKADDIAKTLVNITAGCEDTTIRMFSEMNRHDAVKLYNYLEQYAGVFGFNGEMMIKLKKIVDNKLGNDVFVNLKPTLSNVLKNDIFKLETDDDTYCIPLWHDELEYDLEDKSLIVSINPVLPDNITIDEDNNLHIKELIHISDVFGQDEYEIDLMCKTLKVNVREILLKPKQSVCFSNQGIARINTKNMFSVSRIGHIFVHITLVL